MGFFKAYDMRGTFGADFDLSLVERVGRALPQVVGGGRWLVGRDGRTSSPAVRNALVAGLRAAGADVTDLGLATTPMVYFFTARDGFDGSVMITASHNPPSDNGLKVSRKGALPVGYDSGLAEVEKLAAAHTVSGAADSAMPAAHAAEHPIDEARLADYVAFLKSHAPAGFEGLSFAVDCSDGMASLVAHELFPGAVFLNDSVDGSFPHHSPNPLKADAREQVAAAVRERGLDCGVIFDGDADRCMFVDERGRFIQPDFLIPVLAETYLPEPADGKSRPVAIHDVRTSRAAIERLTSAGFKPVMGKVGHAFAKKLLREVGGVCGGELAGHYYFRDFFNCDSGELAALRMLGAFAQAKRNGQKVSEFMKPITEKYANSGELNFKVPDKKAATSAILAAAASLGTERGRETMDGYRLEFDKGWISVRESNTEPYLRLIVETDTPERLALWTRTLTDRIPGATA